MDDLPQTNPYQTLNVPKDATLATIRSAHRKLVLSCHPDKVQDPAEKLIKAEQFHEVQKAYETLSNEKQRQRYDESVKLAELRKEMMNERSTPRKTDDYFAAPRGGVSPKYDVYDGIRYETRAPPSTSRAYKEDAYTAEYSEDRTSSRKYDERYIFTPRKTSGRMQEDRRKTREVEDERERRAREKEATREAYARDSKKRDKDRRKESEMKSRGKYSPYVDEESDSEVDGRHYKSKRDAVPRPKYEDVRRRSGDDSRKSSKRGPKEYDDSDLEWKTSAAKEYIMSKSREAIEIEPTPRRPTQHRTTSKVETRTPPLPPHPAAEPERRSSGRTRGGSRTLSPVRSSKKDRRTPEIVEIPANSSRKLSVPSGSSFSKGIKSVLNPASSSRSGPQRSATYQQHTTEIRPKPLQRSETMPIDRMHRGESRPLQSSNLKNMKAPSDYSDSSDSESDSEMTEDTPIRPNPRMTSSKYRYVSENEDHYVLEPEDIKPRRSDEIHSNRRPPERPPMPRGSTTRTPPTTGRSTSHIYTPEDRLPRQSYSRTEPARAPPLKSHQSARGSGHLFGEYENYPTKEEVKAKYSPKLDSDDFRNTKSYVRRGSEEPDRDAYPGSHNKRRPHMGRNETVY